MSKYEQMSVVAETVARLNARCLSAETHVTYGGTPQCKEVCQPCIDSNVIRVRTELQREIVRAKALLQAYGFEVKEVK
jgi:hypothetical protein